MKTIITFFRLFCLVLSSAVLVNSFLFVSSVGAQDLKDMVIIVTVDHDEFQQRFRKCLNEKGLPVDKLEVLEREENTTRIVLNEDNKIEFCFIPKLSPEEIDTFIQQLGSYIDEYIAY